MLLNDFYCFPRQEDEETLNEPQKLTFLEWQEWKGGCGREQWHLSAKEQQFTFTQKEGANPPSRLGIATTTKMAMNRNWYSPKILTPHWETPRGSRSNEGIAYPVVWLPRLQDEVDPRGSRSLAIGWFRSRGIDGDGGIGVQDSPPGYRRQHHHWRHLSWHILALKEYFIKQS